MRTITAVLLGALVCCPAAYSQAAPTDSKTLQAILEEVRQVRQDIHATAATVQRAQILIYRIRAQMDVVSRFSQHLEEARLLEQRIKYQRTQHAAHIESLPKEIEDTQDVASRKELERELAIRKIQLEELSNQEQENETKIAEQTTQLRLEQAKLDELESKLDQLEKKLEGAATLSSPRQ